MIKPGKKTCLISGKSTAILKNPDKFAVYQGFYECECGHCFKRGYILFLDVLDKFKNKKYLSFNKVYDAVKYSCFNEHLDVKTLKNITSLFFKNCNGPDELKSFERWQKVPQILCPICNLNYISLSEITKYFCAKYKVDIEDIRSEIKNTYKSKDKFDTYLLDNDEYYDETY